MNPWNKTADYIEEEIKKLKKIHTRWGGSKLVVLLEDKYPIEKLPKESTINEILKRNNLVAPRKRRKQVEPVHPIFDPHSPNKVWSADIKRKFKLGKGKY